MSDDHQCHLMSFLRGVFTIHWYNQIITKTVFRMFGEGGKMFQITEVARWYTKWHICLLCSPFIVFMAICFPISKQQQAANISEHFMCPDCVLKLTHSTWQPHNNVHTIIIPILLRNKLRIRKKRGKKDKKKKNFPRPPYWWLGNEHSPEQCGPQDPWFWLGNFPASLQRHSQLFEAMIWQRGRAYF